jgi:PAS domain S-box-containing protein
MKTANHNGHTVVGRVASNGKHNGAGRRQSHDGLEQRVAELELQAAELAAKNAELVRSNKDLDDAHRQLQALLDNIPDRIYFKDLQSRFVKLNQTLVKRLGVANPEQVIGKTDFDFQLPERAREFYADEQRIMQTGEALINKTEKQIMPNGETAWTSTTKMPMRNPQGNVIGLVGINRDITEIKRAEEASQKSQALYYSLVEQLPVGIFRKDATGRYILVNPRFCQLKGMKAEEFLGKTPEEFAGSEVAKRDTTGEQVKYAAQGAEHHALIMQTGKSIELVEEYTGSDGRKQFVHAIKLPIFDLDGKVIGTQGLLFDITERKLAEGELHRSNEALAVTYRLLQAMLDNVPDRIYFKDTQSRFLNVSRALAKRLGVTDPKQVIGKTDFDFQLPERAKEFYADEQRIMQTGEALINKTERQVLANGAIAWTSTTKAPLRDPEGKVVGLVGINRDITQQKQAEEALQKSDEKLRQFATQLERSNRELQDFAYVASHDLQEPLRKIVVFGERLKEKNNEKFGPESVDFMDRMQNAAARMQTLINDLLTFSRVTTKAQPFTPVNLAEVARGVMDDLEGRIELVKGRVEVGTLPVIDAEPVQMRQLLQNLIGNALKFRRPEEPPVVKVEAQIIPDPDTPEKKLCRLTVSDNCIGFDEKYLDRIFNVFQRLHTRNEYEGTGMGLAIVKKIALYHGGDITAKSKLGEGSTFILTVPVAHPKKTEDDIQNKEDQKP